MGIVLFSITFIATAFGAISGIGGGVIIKPVMDALVDFPIATISFLSGNTVLAMTAVTLHCTEAGRTKSKSMAL